MTAMTYEDVVRRLERNILETANQKAVLCDALAEASALKLACVPENASEGWPGKNETARDLVRDKAYSASPTLQAVLSLVRQTRSHIVSLEARIEADRLILGYLEFAKAEVELGQGLFYRPNEGGPLPEDAVFAGEGDDDLPF